MSSPEKDTNQGVFQQVNDFFCSIKLSIVVLIALAATSIFGTVIQQGKEVEVYVQEYGAGVARLMRQRELVDFGTEWLKRNRT